MELFKLNEPKQLDEFIIKNSAEAGAEFLQSFAWGEISLKEGEEVFRSGAAHQGKLLAVATLIKKNLPLNNFYWYAPRGPLGSAAGIAFLISAIKKLKPRPVFLRFEPSRLESANPEFIKSADLQPQKTLLLDLATSEEALLKAMHPKTRYNIRLAEKKDIEIVSGTASDFAEFWRLLSLTGERDAFRLHSKKHYQNLIGANQEFIKLFFARYQGKNIAAGLFSFFGDKVTYLHGASDNEFRNLMAPYLLQWEIIKMARSAGYKYYDFYGIDEKKWPGVTRFKLGFGGREVSYQGTFDVVFKPGAYRLYRLARKIRRLL